MSIDFECPNCGRRQVSEFSFRGEYRPRPAPDAEFARWVDYVYMRRNVAGVQTEWWIHRPCRRWFLVDRDTTNNLANRSRWFEPPRPIA